MFDYFATKKRDCQTGDLEKNNFVEKEKMFDQN